MAKSRRRTKTRSKTVSVTDALAGAKKTPVLHKPQTPKHSKVFHEAFRPVKTAPASTPATARTPVQFCRRDTKTAMILDLLMQPHGAALSDLIDATGWKPHSIRGFISGTIAKKLGFSVASVKDSDGARRYSIKD